MRANPIPHAAPARARSPDRAPLAGRRILLVEDEALVAMDLEMTLRDAGALVVGPCLRLRGAMDAIGAYELDGALLDIRLGRDETYPAADLLEWKGVGIVFHSAHAGGRALRDRYPRAGHCPKPCAPAVITETLRRTLDRWAAA